MRCQIFEKISKDRLTHCSLLWSVEQSSPVHRVSDVEGMIITTFSRVFPSIDKEGVRSPSLHYQLWDQGVVDVPGNTPARLTY